MSERDRLRSLQTFFPETQTAQAQNPYAGAAQLLQKKVYAGQPFTVDDLANSIRDPNPLSPGAAVDLGRVDPTHPVVRELLKNLPPDIEYIPDHEGAGPTLRLRQSQSEIPTS